MALPTSFLPFDPNRVDNESDDDDDEDDEILPESEEETNELNGIREKMTNGDVNHQEKKPPHIGGGVLLVRIDCITIDLSRWFNLGFC